KFNDTAAITTLGTVIFGKATRDITATINGTIVTIIIIFTLRTGEFITAAKAFFFDLVIRATGKFKPYSTAYLFITSQGNPVNKDTVGLMLRKRTQQAGITKRITPHTFRRSFATILNNNGARLTTIQKLLGHSHITTTAQYIHNDYDTLYADYSKL
ncbi:5641_t:CDS:2, partial [Ambispora gerdemannii]